MNDKTIQDIKKAFDDIQRGKIDRQGYIMMPSFDGYDFFEISTERLKLYLKAEMILKHNSQSKEMDNTLIIKKLDDINFEITKNLNNETNKF